MRMRPDPAAGGLVLGARELATLSEDPDEMARQLQLMAGPGGAQISVDGFAGAPLPAKSAIREVRINSSAYSPEYDKPGTARVEVFTRPGGEGFHGQAGAHFNNQTLNSRSPLAGERAAYRQQIGTAAVSGPLRKDAASFGVEWTGRRIAENAMVLASALDARLQPEAVRQTVVAPERQQQGSARLDAGLAQNHKLSVRYQFSAASKANQGVGDFNLPTRAYRQNAASAGLQALLTSIWGARLVSETRFNWQRSAVSAAADSGLPALVVQGAFSGGGAQVGESRNTSSGFELAGVTLFAQGAHGWKWGYRARESLAGSRQLTNSGGAYLFMGGAGPALGADGLPAAGGAGIPLTALETYRRTVQLSALGYSGAAIRALGGGAAFFSRNSGNPRAGAAQFDGALFAGDEWRARRNLTLSYGVRWEAQTNLGRRADFAPRLGLAWALGGPRPAVTLRASAGVFYDRLSETLTLQARRFDGVRQQSYVVARPDFFPALPGPEQLAAAGAPQQLQPVEPAARTPRLLQASLGADRQFGKALKLSVVYVLGSGARLQRVRNINAPTAGAYPFGDARQRLYTETSARSLVRQLTLTPTLTLGSLSLFGYYSLHFADNNAEGQPADPYNLRAEWGPAASASRHMAVFGARFLLPGRISVLPYFLAYSGRPYNITLGRDGNGDGAAAERPGFARGMVEAGCGGAGLDWRPGFGCFILNPAPGAALGRNSGRGPANWNLLTLSLSRTWAIGQREGAAPAAQPRSASANASAIAAATALSSAQTSGSGRYNVTVMLNATNPLNHANYLVPNGDLSSPYFGRFRASGGLLGASAYGRKLDVQLRFAF